MLTLSRAMYFRVLTYNVHKGIGGIDRRYRPERVMRVVAHYEPDIVLLQEVDDGVPRSDFHCQVEYFADVLGYEHRAYQRNVRLRIGHYGNAVLSRFPFEVIGDVDLTWRFMKRRQALVVRADIHSPVQPHLHGAGWRGQAARGRVQGAGSRGNDEARMTNDEKSSVSPSPFVICHSPHATPPAPPPAPRSLPRIQPVVLANIHLGLAGFERKLQLLRLLEHHYLQHERDTPVIIGGDFNDVWGTLGRRTLEPAGFVSPCAKIRTFPAAMPLRPLDRFYHRGPLAVDDVFAGHIELARQASDHLPLVADFQIIESC